MGTYQILKDDHPILRKKSQNVSDFSKMPKFSGILKRIMKENGGVGLAAPQIGVSLRIIAKLKIPNHHDDMVLINPKIIFKFLKAHTSEGCLSVSNLTKEIDRARFIVVSYRDITGKLQLAFFKDLEAIIIQHEIDHLDGILISDY